MTASSRDLPASKQNELPAEEEKYGDLILNIINLVHGADSDNEIADEDEERKRGEKIKNGLFNNFIMLNTLSKPFSPDTLDKIYKSILKSRTNADLYSLTLFANTFKYVITDLYKTGEIDHKIQAGISAFEAFLGSSIEIIIANEKSDSDSDLEAESDEKDKKIETVLPEVPLEKGKQQPALIIESKEIFDLKIAAKQPALLIKSKEIFDLKIAAKQPELIIESKEIKESKKKNSLTELVIDYEANIHQYPIKNDNEKLTPGKILTVGDMHGNALKFIYILIRHQILDISEEKYNELIKIYNTPVPKRSEQESDPTFEARVIEYKKNMATFDGIIGDAFNKIDPAKVGQLRLIGDIISDRGKSDYFTLKIFECIGKKSPSVIKEILLGNHDYDALIHIYNLNHPDKKINPWFDEKEHAPFKQSFLNLIELIELKLVSLEWVTNTINTHFKPLLKLISYAREESQNKDKWLSLYAHAPTKILLHLKEAISHFKIKPTLSDNKLNNLINDIDAINKILTEAKEISDPDFRQIILPFFEPKIERLTFQNKEEEEALFPRKITDYYTHFISGHHSSLKTYQFLQYPIHSLKSDFEKVLRFTENLENTCTLDNLFGRSSPQAIYFNRLASEPPSLQLMLSIEIILPEIKSLLNNPEISDRFAKALALYEESKNHKEFQKNWKEATDNALFILKKPESPLVSHSLYPAILNPATSRLIEIFDGTNLKISFFNAERESISAKLTPPTSAAISDEPKKLSAEPSLFIH
jgi:hypothetical protein